MNDLAFALLFSLPGSLLADAIARPHASGGVLPLRHWAGTWILWLLTAIAFGLFFALSGNPGLSLVLVLALNMLLVSASNAKIRVLGEPLVFSDLALIGAMFRHPQFYFSVLAPWQKVVGIAASVALIVLLGWLFEPSIDAALIGAGIGAASAMALWLSLKMPPFRDVAAQPDLETDVARLGLVPSLFLYWRRWKTARRELASPAAEEARSAGSPAVPVGQDDQVIVVVQCESFADPKHLFGGAASTLPHLEQARRDAVQWGDLMVSGFGAYTMRTEYGVLFGTDEETLGFRRYDPYLTALQDPARALPSKLGSDRWSSLFVHPHDMRFYDRHRILPQAGFDRLVGEEAFDPPPRGSGRYVEDAAVAAKILELAHSASGSAFIYAVTIENHGPWADDGNAEGGSLVANYERLVRAGDAMLGQLREGLAALRKPSTLVFFGDHRPSIPGASMPGGDRHTPYVILRSDAEGRPLGQASRCEHITPADLHHAILEWGAGFARR